MDLYERSALAYDVLMQARARGAGEQAERVIAVLDGRCPDARSLLDVACGSGAHLTAFGERFEVVGVDLSAAMLARARARLPHAPLHHGDMRTFDLGRAFDVVTCLFSSVGYMLTLDDLTRAIANMARHVEPGGVLFVEPWIHPDAWKVGRRVAEAANDAGVAVARVSVNGRDGRESWFDLHWTVATEDGVDTFSEHHRLGLFTVAEYEETMRAAGLDVEHDPDGLIGRGLFIGTRRS